MLESAQERYNEWYDPDKWIESIDTSNICPKCESRLLINIDSGRTRCKNDCSERKNA